LIARAAVIVAHGSPSDPPRQEAAMAGFARAVARHRPGLRVASATLADPAALPRALAAAGDGAVVYPMFMSDGWFVSDLLPKRLAKAGAAGVGILPPFGLDPDLPAFCAARLAEAARSGGLDPAAATLVLAAHGSPSDPRAGAAARAAAEGIAALMRFAEIRVCFVDQAPFLAEGLSVHGPAICLPFFATAASHVEADLPEAVAAAGFAGRVLEPIGRSLGTPAFVARRLSALAPAAPDAREFDLPQRCGPDRRLSALSPR
jgi:sirohydrochlorin ferrochelatase